MKQKHYQLLWAFASVIYFAACKLNNNGRYGCDKDVLRLNHIASSKEKGKEQEFRELLEKGVPFSARCKLHDKTPLMLAVQLGRKDLVEACLEKIQDEGDKALLNVANNSGETALMHAFMNPLKDLPGTDESLAAGKHLKSEIALLLLEHGADPYKENNLGQTAPMLAIGAHFSNFAQGTDAKEYAKKYGKEFFYNFLQKGVQKKLIDNSSFLFF